MRALSLLIAFLSLSQVIKGQTYTLTLQPGTSDGNDAVVSKANPTTNYSSTTVFKASRNTSSEYDRSLIKFDLSSIPPGMEVVSAKLYLYGVSHQLGGGDGSGVLQMVPDKWLQTLATWNNSELLKASGMLTVSISAPVVSGQNYALDVTAMAQKMINTPLVNFGWLMHMSVENNSSNRALVFGSSDNSTSSLRPKLEIVYSEPITVNASATPSERDTSHNGGVYMNVTGGVPPFTYNWSDGKTTKDNFNVLPGVYQFTVTDSRGKKVIRPVAIPSGCGVSTFTVDYSGTGSSSDVTMLRESFNDNTQNQNFGTASGITAYNKSTSSGISLARSMVSFNLNSLPENVHIDNAILKLTDNETTYGSTFKVQLARVTGSWKESTVTFSNQPTYSDSLGDILEIDYDASQAVYDFDVTSQLQKMIDARNTTPGWILKLKTENETTYGKSVTFIGDNSVSGARPTLILQVSLTDHECDDDDLNWHQEDVYDESGAVISSEKTYFDNMGRNTQHLTRNGANEVFTSQMVYDSYGRSSISTMPAFTGSQLVYHPGFMRSQAGQLYQYTNFDTPTKLNNPDPLQDGVVNTLGYYYSNNNSYDSFQAIAENPYERLEYEGAPTGTVRRNSKPGTAFKMGSNRENYSFTMVSGNELANVYGSGLSYKAKESSSDPLDCTSLSTGVPIIATKQVVITPDNLEMVTYSSGEKLLAAGYSGLTADPCNFSVQNVLSYKGTQSTDIHLPDANKLSLMLSLPTQQGDLLPMSASNITFKITDLYRDVVLVENVDYFVDSGTRLVTFDTPFLALHTGRGLVLRISFTYNSVYEANLISNAITPADVTIGYIVDYGRFSKNYYDISGALLKSVSTKGFGCSNPNTISMASTFNYNYRGQLIASKKPDEGTTELMYDKEGKLRFSQNQEQKSANRFSYVSYDKHGRPVESGEYQSSLSVGSVWFNTPSAYSGTVSASSILDVSDGLPGGAKSFVTRTGYTEPALTDDVPSGYSYYSQYRNFRNGKINFVKNQNSIVWYNYDKFDRPKATITQVIESDFVAKNSGIDNQIKTSEADYNYFTGLTSADTYQTNNANEKLKYQYNYDVNYRLSTCSLTYGGTTRKLTENFYDKAGRVKRVVTGNNLQGTDFVYTLNGGIKAINHPALDPTRDPGGDNGDYFGTNSNVNKDIFGEVIDYYSGDYERNNTYIGSSIASMTSKYNGLIYAARFKTRGTVGSDQSRANFVDYGGANQDSILTGSSYVQKEFRFAYTYDELNQLATSVFGIYDNSTLTYNAYNGYSEKGASNGDIGYDRNGNLTRLVRKAYRNVSTNTAINLDDLTYTIGSGNNQSTAILDAASNSFPQSVNFQTPSQVSASSFVYNTIGQLTQSPAEDISSITYFPNGKIKKITFNSTGNTTEYEYGANGQKLKSKYHISATNKNKYTWYVGPYIYEYTETDPSPAFKIAEAKIAVGTIRVNGGTNVGTGYIVYHITDHLGNVRATYKASGTGNGINLLSRDDYYAFGGQMPGRSWKTEDCRFAYQGNEKPGESNPWDQFELRMYNHDLGRWFAPDPYGEFASPYVGMGNNPVSLTDLDGGRTSLPTGKPGERFSGGEELERQRENRTGAFSWEETQKRYEEEYGNLLKHYNESGRTDPTAFLDAVLTLNSYYCGLTKMSGEQPAFNSGVMELTQNELSDITTTAGRNATSTYAMLGTNLNMSAALVNIDVDFLERQTTDRSSKKRVRYSGSASIIDPQGRVVVDYYSDGSEVRNYFDKDGNLYSVGFRSPEYAAHMANGGTMANYRPNKFAGEGEDYAGSVGAPKDQCFSEYTQPAVLNMNTNTNPDEVVATFIAAIQYEVTNGNGATRANIFQYFNNTGGQGTYNFGPINFTIQGTNITSNSVVFDYTGTSPMARGAIVVLNPSELPVNRLINNALDCRDNYFGGFRNHSGFNIPQFQGMPYGFRLPQ